LPPTSWTSGRGIAQQQHFATLAASLLADNEKKTKTSTAIQHEKLLKKAHQGGPKCAVVMARFDTDFQF
jgi:hypothetical protein